MKSNSDSLFKIRKGGQYAILNIQLPHFKYYLIFSLSSHEKLPVSGQYIEVQNIGQLLK